MLEILVETVVEPLSAKTPLSAKIAVSVGTSARYLQKNPLSAKLKVHIEPLSANFADSVEVNYINK